MILSIQFCWAIRHAISPIGPSPKINNEPPSYSRVLHRLPGGRQYVRQVDEAVVRSSVITASRRE
jgi:hypothetical protein